MLYVTVCDNCKQSSCWQGLFMCSKSQSAGTVDIPLESLLIMGIEHESYLVPYAFEKSTKCVFPDNYIICGAYDGNGNCKSPKGACRLSKC